MKINNDYAKMHLLLKLLDFKTDMILIDESKVFKTTKKQVIDGIITPDGYCIGKELFGYPQLFNIKYKINGNTIKINKRIKGDVIHVYESLIIHLSKKLNIQIPAYIYTQVELEYI